ncbi:MAG TPA: SIS domain-containing protein [Anaerolineae bacterium]|nr:SIS domain-containing protein [Anaerolineae bacterium]
MRRYEEYFTKVLKIVNSVLDTQGQNIELAAEIVSQTIAKDGLVHALGVGHSHCLAEEVFWRAGTLVPIHAILEPSMIGMTEIIKSAYMEKLEGTGSIICDYHRIDPPDALIAISNSGNNAMPIDVAMEAKKRGVKVIAICSATFAKNLEPRHSSGKKLIDIADVVIDNCGQIGDTCMHIEGLEQGLGPTSTITGAFIINSLLVQAAANLNEAGIKPIVYWSGNLKDGMKANQEYVNRYWTRIRNL